MPTNDMQAENPIIKNASLVKRLLAMAYDSLLVIATLMVTTGLYMGIHSAIVGSENYQALADNGNLSSDPLLSSVLFCTLFFFFGFFWTKNGQTLGMQVWRIKIQNRQNQNPTWKEAFLRFIGAIISTLTAGAGYFWMLIDKEGRSLQCIISGTKVVQITKDTPKQETQINNQ